MHVPLNTWEQCVHTKVMATGMAVLVVARHGLHRLTLFAKACNHFSSTNCATVICKWGTHFFSRTGHTRRA